MLLLPVFPLWLPLLRDVVAAAVLAGQAVWVGPRVGALKVAGLRWFLKLVGVVVCLKVAACGRRLHQSLVRLSPQSLLVALFRSLLVLAPRRPLVLRLALVDWLPRGVFRGLMPQAALRYLSACQLAVLAWTLVRDPLWQFAKSLKAVFVRVRDSLLLLAVAFPLWPNVLHLAGHVKRAVADVPQLWLPLVLPWFLLPVMLAASLLQQHLL